MHKKYICEPFFICVYFNVYIELEIFPCALKNIVVEREIYI